jgi:hypothetical protein
VLQLKCRWLVSVVALLACNKDAKMCGKNIPGNLKVIFQVDFQTQRAILWFWFFKSDSASIDTMASLG